MGVLDGLKQLQAMFTDAGLRAHYDGAKVNPPGVWLSAQTLEPNLCGGGSLTVHVYLISPDTAPVAAYRILDGLLEDVLALPIDLAEDTSVRESVALTDGAGAMPAYRLTTTTEI